MKLYHQIDRSSGEVLGLTTSRCNLNTFDYLLEHDDDILFLDAWRKSWPEVKPLLSELKLFRKWRNTERQFKAIHLRPTGIIQ